MSVAPPAHAAPLRQPRLPAALARRLVGPGARRRRRAIGGPRPCLPPPAPAQAFKPLTLTRVDELTHNTKRFVFGLPDARMRLGLPTGQHITFLAKDGDGKDVYRPYTPTTDDDTIGAVEFVIKLYPQGKMSQARRARRARVSNAQL